MAHGFLRYSQNWIIFVMKLVWWNLEISCEFCRSWKKKLVGMNLEYKKWVYSPVWFLKLVVEVRNRFYMIVDDYWICLWLVEAKYSLWLLCCKFRFLNSIKFNILLSFQNKFIKCLNIVEVLNGVVWVNLFIQ